MSKKRSGSSKPHRSLPTIFLDENMGSPELVEELRTLQCWAVEYQLDHLDVFPRGMLDPDLIAECGRRTWAIISCDDRFRYQKRSKEAVVQHKVKVLMFPEGEYSGLQYRSALVAAHQRILSLLRKHVGTHCFARILVSGEIRPLEQKQRSAMTSREKTASKYGAHVIQETGIV
jgi:PIN domain-containing protein